MNRGRVAPPHDMRRLHLTAAERHRRMKCDGYIQELQKTKVWLVENEEGRC
jgi:hypothetical protein